MGIKRLDYTPNSQIKSALRRLFLRSRERSFVLRRDHYTCVRCGAKQSRAKGREVYVECHHRDGVQNWAELYAIIRMFLLTSPEDMETMCETCHASEAQNEAIISRNG